MGRLAYGLLLRSDCDPENLDFSLIKLLDFDCIDFWPPIEDELLDDPRFPDELDFWYSNFCDIFWLDDDELLPCDDFLDNGPLFTPGFKPVWWCFGDDVCDFPAKLPELLFDEELDVDGDDEPVSEDDDLVLFIVILIPSLVEDFTWYSVFLPPTKI